MFAVKLLSMLNNNNNNTNLRSVSDANICIVFINFNLLLSNLKNRLSLIYLNIFVS